MKTLRCGRVRRDLLRYHDQEAGERRASEIARHLAGCPDCRREAEGLLAFRSLWADPPVLPSVAADRLAILRAARPDSAARRRGAENRRTRLFGSAPAFRLGDLATGGALAVCALLAVLFLSERRRQSYVDHLPRSSAVLSLSEMEARKESRPLEPGVSLELEAP